jgi:hypothetical protein
VRRIFAAVAALGALAVVGLAAPVARAVVPDNVPANGQEVIGQNNGNERAYLYVSGNIHSGTLYAGDSSGGTPFEYQTSTRELHEWSPNEGYCVYYNASAGKEDILTCNSAKTSDQWTFGSGVYSEMISRYNTSICTWYNNDNTPVLPIACNASVAGDKWNWYSI